MILFVLVDAILQKVVFLNKKSGIFFYFRFQLLTSRQNEKLIFQATTIFSSISWIFRHSDGVLIKSGVAITWIRYFRRKWVCRVCSKYLAHNTSKDFGQKNLDLNTNLHTKFLVAFADPVFFMIFFLSLS